MKMILLFALISLAAGCGGSGVSPAVLTAGVSCSECRMTVSDPKLAAQIVAPGEEPLFFDDIGCLASYLGEHRLAHGGEAFVADHVSGAWIRADRAVYSRSEAIATPMASHVVAHADDAARTADPSVRTAARLRAEDVFGGHLQGARP